MIDWEISLQKFIDDWKSKDYVLGCLLTGSFAVGNNTKNSDIDVVIILCDDIDWRERGNIVIDSYIIEYFANPIKQIISYMDDGIRNGNRIDACMFTNGKVLFDKAGVVEGLISRAQNDIHKDLVDIDTSELMMAKYHLWDIFEETKETYISKAANYFSLHYLCLDNIITLYSKYTKNLLPAKDKIHRFLIDEEYAHKYGIPMYSDQYFVELYLACYKQSTENAFQSLSALMAYVLEKIGGFDIDGFKIRSCLSI